MRTLLLPGLVALLLAGVPATGIGSPAAPGVDEHTVSLWLFDDPPYGNVTLTDAGPLQVDLRLDAGAGKTYGLLEGQLGLAQGRFGGALHLPVGQGGGVTWPRGNRPRYGFSPFFSRGDEVPEQWNIGSLDWTLEAWFKASGEQRGRGVLFELRNESGEAAASCPTGVNALALEPGRRGFVLQSRLLSLYPWDVEIAIPTDAALLNDGSWHHLAFTFEARERQLRHYLDGQLQPLPEKGGFLPLMGRLVSLRVGRDVDGGQELSGWLDEMRLSDVVRYRAQFTPPASFSLNYGAGAYAPARPSGPPLLFGPDAAGGPLRLGGRKHVFIDDALLERKQNVRLSVNPPTSFQVTDFLNDQFWEPTPRMGPAIPDIGSVWDDGNEIRMIYTNNGIWGGKPYLVGLARSEDGVHWTKPPLGLYTLDGSHPNNVVLRNASQGTVFRDPNPDVRPEDRYKYMAWCMDRGIYLFTSPDAVHWRRNEVMALPFDPDGSVSVYWDDQVGVYRAYVRATMPSEVRRRVVRARTREILKPWPFVPSRSPLWHNDFPHPKPASGELPLVDTGGQIYRFKGIKYPWAPDVYLAFPWRYLADGNIRPGSFLMTSRDGESWTRYETPYYFAAGLELDGRKALEALMEQGMVRRGDAIWQFGTVRFTEHGGILYGGVEHEGGYHDRLLRLVQRLDGFIALEAGKERGTVVTRPLTFEGSRLVLNLAVQGSLRVGLLDEAGRLLAGVRLADCDPIRADSTQYQVSWRNGSDLSRFAGRVVRLQFELSNARLFALQFAR